MELTRQYNHNLVCFVNRVRFIKIKIKFVIKYKIDYYLLLLIFFAKVIFFL
jgi:hypothetical protein